VPTYNREGPILALVTSSLSFGAVCRQAVLLIAVSRVHVDITVDRRDQPLRIGGVSMERS
jgi:hypothetical protein